MGDFEVGKQLELYSNAILAFMVFQGLAFCYNFGTDQRFSQIFKSDKQLSLIFLAAFIMVWVVSAFFNFKISAALQARTQDRDKKIIRQIYLGKMLAITLFGFLPILITWRYGLL